MISDDRSGGFGPLADIGQLGLETAAAVVERMLDLTRRVGDLRIPATPPRAVVAQDGDRDADWRSTVRGLRADADRMIDIYADWARSLLDLVVDLVEDATAAARSVRPTADVLDLGPGRPRQSVSAEAWLHVLDGPPASPAPLKATILTSHEGKTISGRTITCDPAALDTFALRSTRPVKVTLKIPATAIPGIYHGYLLASGLPEVCLPTRLEVER